MNRNYHKIEINPKKKERKKYAYHEVRRTLNLTLPLTVKFNLFSPISQSQRCSLPPYLRALYIELSDFRHLIQKTFRWIIISTKEYSPLPKYPLNYTTSRQKVIWFLLIKNFTIFRWLPFTLILSVVYLLRVDKFSVYHLLT